MRTRITLLAVSIMFAAAASSFAGAGAFLTYQDAGDADSGYGIGLKLERDLAPQVSLDGRLSIITGTSIGRWDEDLTIIPIEANLNWNVPMMGYTPYFGAGIGYYYFDPDWIDADIGFNIHGGVKLDTGRGMQAFAELRYLNLEPDGGDFGGIGLVGGISWGVW